MYDEHATPNTNGPAGRVPFGELHAAALRAMPADGNGQRKAFMDGRPNVWWTLRRHFEGMRDNGATRAQFDRLLTTLADEVDAWYGEPTQSLAEISIEDASAEGVENMSEIDAVDAVARNGDALGRLQRLHTNALADMTTSRQLARVAAREMRARRARA